MRTKPKGIVPKAAGSPITIKLDGGDHEAIIAKQKAWGYDVAADIERGTLPTAEDKIQLVGRDSKGNVIAVHEPWPASIRNAPAHSRSPFSSTAFPYDRSIKTLTAEVIHVKQWRQ